MSIHSLYKSVPNNCFVKKSTVTNQDQHQWSNWSYSSYWLKIDFFELYQGVHRSLHNLHNLINLHQNHQLPRTNQLLRKEYAIHLSCILGQHYLWNFQYRIVWVQLFKKGKFQHHNLHKRIVPRHNYLITGKCGWRVSNRLNMVDQLSFLWTIGHLEGFQIYQLQDQGRGLCFQSLWRYLHTHLRLDSMDIHAFQPNYLNFVLT